MADVWMPLESRGEEFREGTRPRDFRGRRDAELFRRRLSGDELDPLTRIVPWRSALAVVQTWLIIAATIAIVLVGGSWPLVIAAVVIIAGQQHALFILSHDAAHYRLFGNRSLNDLIGRACATAAGLSMCTYRVIHRLHHNHLYGPLDPDMALHGGYPRGKWYLGKKLLKDLSGLTAAKTYGYFFGNPARNLDTGSTPQPLADTSERLRTAARRDQKVVIGSHIALPLLIVCLGGWSALGVYLLLWVVPAWTVLQAILRLRAVCEHGALTDVSSPLTAARTHVLGFDLASLLARATLFPHHVNYHVEHHLYPSVPHYNLPRLHAMLGRRGLLVGKAHGIAQTLPMIFAERRTKAAS